MKKILKLILMLIYLFATILTIIKINSILKENNINNNITLNYPYIGNPHEDYISISDGKKIGYINLKTNTIINNKLNYYLPQNENNTNIDLEQFYFTDQIAPIVNKNNKYGIIDTNGNEIIKPQYDFLKIINNELIIVNKNHSYSLIDSTNKKINDNNYEHIEIRENITSLLITQNNNYYGIINSKGEIILENNYNNISIKSNKTKDIIVIQAKKENIIENYYYHQNKLEKINDYNNLNFYFIEGNKIYYTNESGIYNIYDISSKEMTILKENYIAIGPFINNLALAINENGKIGYINELEEIIIPYKYDYNFTSNFTEFGYAVVGYNEKVGIINTKEEKILEPIYEQVLILDKDHFLVLENNQTNIININKNNITNNKYSQIITIENYPYLLVSNNNIYGLIDYNGKEILPLKYKNIKVYNNYFVLQESENKYIIKSNKTN